MTDTEAARAFNPSKHPRGKDGEFTAALMDLADGMFKAQDREAAAEARKAAHAERHGDRAAALRHLKHAHAKSGHHKHRQSMEKIGADMFNTMGTAEFKGHGRQHTAFSHIDALARADWRETLHPRDKRGEFATKQSMLDTADDAARLLGPDSEVPAHLRAAGEAAGHKDYRTAGGHLAKAREGLDQNITGAHTGVIETDVAEHPKAQQRRKLAERLRTHQRQVRERTGGSMTRGLGWDTSELELLVRADHFNAKLHPRDRRGEFARKPGGGRPGGRRPSGGRPRQQATPRPGGAYGHLPAGMDTPNMRLAEAAGFVKAGKVEDTALHHGGGRPVQASGGGDVRVVSSRKRVTKTSGPGGTRVTASASSSTATVSLEQFTSAVDGLQKSIDAQRDDLDRKHQAEIDALKQQIIHARDDAVQEIQAEHHELEKRRAIRKWINHLLGLAAVGLLTYMEAHGMHTEGAEATIAGVGGPILAAIAAVGPLFVSEVVDFAKKL